MRAKEKNMEYKPALSSYERAAQWLNYGVRAGGIGIGAGFFFGEWWGVFYAALWFACDLLHDAAVDWHSRKRTYVTRSTTAVQIGMFIALYFSSFYISWRKIGLIIATVGLGIATSIGVLLRRHVVASDE